MQVRWQQHTGSLPLASWDSRCHWSAHRVDLKAVSAHRIQPSTRLHRGKSQKAEAHTSFRQRKRQRHHLFALRSQADDELERSIQQGLDDQSLRALQLKAQAEDFKESNDKLEELAESVREGLGGTSIYLVGMMGSGKSTVGKLVADALDYPLLDSDEVAEEFAECSIAEIFSNEGEESFRELETKVLQELMPFKACVVSTGGGVVERRRNWGYMQHGIVIWLDGPPELLARRACQDGQSSRPLLGSTDQELSEEEQLEATTAKLSEILDRRRDQYAQADITVSLQAADKDPKGASIAVVANRLLEALESRMQSDKGSKGKKPPKKEFKGFGPSP